MALMLVQILSFALPWRLRRWLLCKLHGHRIDPMARIGFSLVLVRHLDMEAGARIGSLTIVKGLDLLELGVHARLGNLNWVSGFPSGTRSPHFSEQSERTVVLRIGDHAAVTNRHLLDCTGGIFIGRFSTFAGFRSQVLTHSIDIGESRQRAASVRIGEYCFVGTGSILLGGSVLPDYSVLGAGSVLNKAHERTYMLYAGNPAREIKPINRDAAYFNRTRGFVD